MLMVRFGVVPLALRQHGPLFANTGGDFQGDLPLRLILRPDGCAVLLWLHRRPTATRIVRAELILDMRVLKEVSDDLSNDVTLGSYSSLMASVWPSPAQTDWYVGAAVVLPPVYPTVLSTTPHNRW